MASLNDQRVRGYVAPASTATAMTKGSTYPAGRALLIDCTATGTVIANLADGTSTITINVQAAGQLEFNWSVIGISNSSTATATFYNLY